ncbi:PITH domain-containing protein [Lipomyces oligophaga]|uniref:PITH domain-containing protein n=1 Tax=Lipomyces oligophaga TaxID=45792 RepID=UPI0034CFF6BD
MAGVIKVITSEEEFGSLSQHGLAVVDFNATWCGPCKVIGPHFEELARRFSNVVFASVDIDLNKSIAGRYKITAVPSFLFLNKGNEVARVRGANLAQITSELQNCLHYANTEESSNSGTSSAPSADVVSGGVSLTWKSLIPTGFGSINDSIDMSSLEALNVEPGRTGTDLRESVKALFSEPPKEAAKQAQIVSDADSQVLVYLQFMNASKVHTILVQTTVPGESGNSEESNIQRPSKLKIWTNRPSILSFDDATSSPPVHEVDLPAPDENGWSVVKLRYVRFQQVYSVVLFFEGDDEDDPIAINRIVFIGEKGEKLEMGKLQTHSHE